MTILIVAIDGPSGVGKSSVGRRLAQRLGVPYLDTGAMYRAVGLATRRSGIHLPLGPSDEGRVVEIAEAATVAVTGSAQDARTYLDGQDVSAEIRDPEISRYASAVSAVPGVRRRLAGIQRELAFSAGGVLEGRDIGTKVAPEAPNKFFLTASPEVRAGRRYKELQAKGAAQPFAQVLEEMTARDQADSTRAESPLVCDERYMAVDTSEKSVEEVVDLLLGHVARGSGADGSTG